MLFNTLGIEYEDDQSNQQAYTKEFWIGIGVSVITNLVQAFAMAFQRKSHLQNDKYPIEDRKSALKRPLWVASFATFLTANIIGSVCSIGYLPIVILAPIGAMGLVFNAIAAKIVLGDPFKKKTVIGKNISSTLPKLSFVLIKLFRYFSNCHWCFTRGIIWCHS